MKRLNCAMSVECLGHFSGIVPSLTFILTKQHGVCCGKYLLKTSGNAILGLKISKCSQRPWSSRTCAFSASTKATFYSLWACYLKTFWQPCMSFLSLLFNYYCTNIFICWLAKWVTLQNTLTFDAKIVIQWNLYWADIPYKSSTKPCLEIYVLYFPL